MTGHPPKLIEEIGPFAASTGYISFGPPDQR
jgi:hypothetical protein